MITQWFLRMSTEDTYMLHCSHHGHSCQHPYPTLGLAVLAAQQGVDSHALEHVSHISRGDRVVLDSAELTDRIEQIRAIPYN